MQLTIPLLWERYVCGLYTNQRERRLNYYSRWNYFRASVLSEIFKEISIFEFFINSSSYVILRDLFADLSVCYPSMRILLWEHVTVFRMKYSMMDLKSSENIYQYYSAVRNFRRINVIYFRQFLLLQDNNLTMLATNFSLVTAPVKIMQTSLWINFFPFSPRRTKLITIFLDIREKTFLLVTCTG